MTKVHRDTDARVCGAATTVAGNSTVKVNGLLASVNGDPNSHGGGAISASTARVFVEGKMLVEVGDAAAPDGLCPPVGGAHCAPATASGSPDVVVGS
jgi:uncharacterized Zn-binding protein involved in type VI secretion